MLQKNCSKNFSGALFSVNVSHNFLDFVKAFGTVNQEILLQKLKYYGIRDKALLWFTSYLTNRTQYSEIGESLRNRIYQLWCSTGKCTRSCTIFIIVFADDTTLFHSDKTNAETENTLNTKLSLIVGKSNFIKVVTW